MQASLHGVSGKRAEQGDASAKAGLASREGYRQGEPSALSAFWLSRSPDLVSYTVFRIRFRLNLKQTEGAMALTSLIL